MITSVLEIAGATAALLLAPFLAAALSIGLRRLWRTITDE